MGTRAERNVHRGSPTKSPQRFHGDAMSPHGPPGDFEFGADKAPPSSKVREIASIIASVEERCEFLEHRNAWLTKELLKRQRSFVEKNFMNKASGRVRMAFEGWGRVMRELKLENNLEEANSKLEECRKIAENLGSALNREREEKELIEAEQAPFRLQLERIVTDNSELRRQVEQSRRQREIMEMAVQGAERALSRLKLDGTGIVEAATAYERAKRDIERDWVDVESSALSPVEEGHRLCEEAYDTMKRLNNVIMDSRTSPTRARARAVTTAM